MTQMLLFDTPANSNDFAASVVSVADCPSENNEGREVAAATERLVSEAEADRGGMHHMGDLARLVLLRYEMVAQRRAALAAKAAR